MIDYELWEEDEERFYEVTLLSDIEDCEYCLFNDDREYCDKHVDGYNPCEYSDCEFRGMTMVEIRDELDRQRIDYEGYLDRQYLKEKELQEKKEKAAERRRQTRWENSDLNNELKSLRKSIKAMKDYLIGVDTLSSAMAFVNNKPNEERTEKHPYELEIERMEQRIEEIKMEKRDRARERRS